MDIIGITGIIIGIVGIIIAFITWCYSSKPPSNKGKRYISKYAHQEFPDPVLLQEWETFDLKFYSICIGKTHRGIVFKGDLCKSFLSEYESDPKKLKVFLTKSAKIYALCSKNRTWRCKDKRFFTQIALVYGDLAK